MADVTAAPVPTGASEFDVPAALGALADHFGGGDMFARANLAAFPSSGNWPGRLLMAIDTGLVYRWNGSWAVVRDEGSWVQIGSGPGTGSFGTGWTGATNSARRAVSVKRIGSRVYIEGVLAKASGWSAGDVVVNLPAGFVPAVRVDVPFRSGSSLIQVFANTTGTLTVQETSGAAGSLVALGGASWALD